MSNKEDAIYHIGCGPAALLLDHLMDRHALKNDSALSRFLGVAPPIISKIRNDKYPVGASFILKCHEIGGMSVAEVRAFIGGQA